MEQLRVNQKVEALHLNRKYLDAKYASKCASASDGEETEVPKHPFEAMTISSMMTASSLGIFEVMTKPPLVVIFFSGELIEAFVEYDLALLVKAVLLLLLLLILLSLLNVVNLFVSY